MCVLLRSLQGRSRISLLSLNIVYFFVLVLCYFEHDVVKVEKYPTCLPCVADLYCLRTGSDQPSLLTCGLNTSD